MNNEFFDKLDAAGYFKGLSSDAIPNLKNEFEQRGCNAIFGGWDAVFVDSHRLFHADAEDLAEGGIGKFIREVEPFLSAQEVHLPEVEDEVSESGYQVLIDGAKYKIYDQAELKRDCSGEQPGLIWGLSAARGFKMVNELLSSAGSKERVYAVNGGNDLFALFLTPLLFTLIMEHPDVSPEDRPYQPTEEYPWHGASH